MKAIIPDVCDMSEDSKIDLKTQIPFKSFFFEMQKGNSEINRVFFFSKLQCYAKFRVKFRIFIFSMFESNLQVRVHYFVK